MQSKWYCVILPVAVVLAAAACRADDPATTQPPPPRMANGLIIEGDVLNVSEEGLTVQSPKGVVTYPWRYLSTGTRYRYQRNKPLPEPSPIEQPAAEDGPE